VSSLLDPAAVELPDLEEARRLMSQVLHLEIVVQSIESSDRLGLRLESLAHAAQT
jgi:hypothetical protein